MELVHSNGDWAFAFLGMVAFAESLFLVGLFIPATPVFLAFGGLIAAGALEPVPLLGVTVAGAVAGNIVSYIIGRKLGRRMIYSPLGSPHRKKIAKARLFFRRYGFLSVFLCRFFGPLRATVPFVAGMTGMKQTRFQTANCLSAAIWSPMMLLPGWLSVTGYQVI
jgi:membrane protein DedA with SNARE-associated domain